MNNKKFRIWDDKVIAEYYETALAIRDNVLKQCAQHQVNPEDLPQSVIPTEILYDLATVFEVVVDKLYAHELITGGYIKDTKSIH